MRRRDHSCLGSDQGARRADSVGYGAAGFGGQMGAGRGPWTSIGAASNMPGEIVNASLRGSGDGGDAAGRRRARTASQIITADYLLEATDFRTPAAAFAPRDAHALLRATPPVLEPIRRKANDCLVGRLGAVDLRRSEASSGADHSSGATRCDQNGDWIRGREQCAAGVAIVERMAIGNRGRSKTLGAVLVAPEMTRSSLAVNSWHSE